MSHFRQDLLNSLCGFPQTKTWHHVPLNECAIADSFGNPDWGKRRQLNPLLDPAYCAKWVAKQAACKSVDHTYGGYLEDRSFLWRGSYLTAKTGFTHLGVDINVPAGTPVYCPVPFRIVEAFRDPDQNGGWGGRLVIQTWKDALVVFAHLDPHGLLRLDDTCMPAHTCVGYVAPAYRNGNWFPHLHLQGLASLDLLNGLDGYGPARRSNAERYPEPLGLLTP